MEKSKIINLVRKEKAPGPPKVRTADLWVLIETIKPVWFKLRGEGLADFNERVSQLSRLVRTISPLIDYFPEFLSEYIKGWRSVESLRWEDTLSIFLYFCERILDACWFIANKYPNQLHEDKHVPTAEIVTTFEGERRRMRWTVPPARKYVPQALENGLITIEGINAVSSMKQAPSDIFTDTLTADLMLTAVGLKDPYLVECVKYYLDQVVKCAKEQRPSTPTLSSQGTNGDSMTEKKAPRARRESSYRSGRVP